MFVYNTTFSLLEIEADVLKCRQTKGRTDRQTYRQFDIINTFYGIT